MRPPLPLGTKTKWGTIVMIRFADGERYYFMIDHYGTVSMMPANLVDKTEERGEK